MKGFEEQDLFTGAVQAQGFAPDQAPDTSSFLRENMGMVDKNYAQAESVQNTELIAKLQTQMNVLKGLQAFSPKAMELATNLGKAYIESEYTKATAKARAMGPAFNYGVSEDQQNIYDQTKAALGKEQLTVNEIADEAARNGEPLEAINYIKSLPYYQRIRAQEIFLDNKGREYKAAKDAFLQRTDINLPLPDGSGFFTPTQVDDQADRAQIVNAAFHKLYMVESGVAEMQPNSAAMKYMYQHMDKADAEYLQAIRNNQAINTSEEFLTNSVQAFYEDKDINTLISNTQGAYNPKTGKPYTRAQARAFALQTVVDQYAAGDTDALAVLDQPVSWDPKGRTFMELYEKEIKGVNGVLDKIDAIDAAEYTTTTNQKKQKLRDVIAETQTFLENATEEERSDPQFYIRLKQQLRPEYGEVNSDRFVDNLEKAYRPDKLRDEQMDPLMAKQAAINGLTDEWLDVHQVSYDLRRKYANEIQTSNAINIEAKKDQEKSVRNLIRNQAKIAPDGSTAPLVNLIEADLVNMWRTETRRLIEEGVSPNEASARAVVKVQAHYSANDKDTVGGLYYQDPNDGGEYTNYKAELGKRGVNAANISQRYNNLERLLKVYDGDFNSLIKSGQLFSKPDLEKINTIMERDPFLLSIDRNSPLYARVQQAKALLTRNNPNLPFPKLLERTYDLMDMPVPPALQEIGPKLEQLTPNQNRFLNKLFVTGDVTQNQINRAITPISQVPVRPGKEYALAQTGMSGLRGLTRSGEGGYTSMFPSEAYPQMTNMTIRELVAFQKEKLRDGRKSAAVGAYQFLYPEVAAKRAGLSLDDKFTPENQDKMFDATLMQKRRKINNYLTGKSDDIEAALDELAMEFASFEYRGGRSYYNDGVNKASIMRTKAAAALKSARQEMMRGGS